MARPRKAASTNYDLTPGQANYVLQKLVDARRVTATEVKRYVAEMQDEIKHLETRLQSLREATGGAIRSAIQALTPGRRRGRPAKAASTTSAPAASGSAKRGRKRGANVTAEQRASRQIQGRYLGLIRQIPSSRRAQYQRIAKERGREAAIKEMQTVLNK